MADAAAELSEKALTIQTIDGTHSAYGTNMNTTDTFYPIVKSVCALSLLECEFDSSISLIGLVRSLDDNTTLKFLWVRACKINDISAIAEALHGNKTLELLDLSGNPITDGTPLIKLLATNTTLLNVYVHKTQIPKDQSRQIDELTRGNRMLKSAFDA